MKSIRSINCIQFKVSCIFIDELYVDLSDQPPNISTQFFTDDLSAISVPYFPFVYHCHDFKQL